MHHNHHRPSLLPPKLLPLLPLLRRRRHRQLRLPPTPPLRRLLHRHRPRRPLQLRPLRLLLLRLVAARLQTRAPLLLSRELLRRREAQMTTIPSRLGNQTFPTWLWLLSTWERWFASLVDLVRRGRCVPYPSPIFSCTDGGG